MCSKSTVVIECCCDEIRHVYNGICSLNVYYPGKFKLFDDEINQRQRFQRDEKRRKR
jgi:hypothetical protein